MKKNIPTIFLLILLCAAGITVQGIGITHGPYLQNVSDREATIVWTTDKTAVSWVEIAPDDGTNFYLTERPKTFAVKNGIKLENTVHAVKIKGLSPAVKYRYRIFSQEILEHDGHGVVYGSVASSTAYTPFTFSTLNPEKQAISFTMANDVHGRSNVLEQLLGHADPMSDDLVFFNGDMVSSLTSEDELFTGFMDASVKAFAAQIPMYYARGNHETRGIFATRFQDYFSTLQPELYYLVRQGPVCFLVLDCGEDKPDSDIEYSGITAYDDYRTQEAEWLREAVKSKTFLDAPFKVVICHIPPSEGWHGEAEILQKFVPILNEAKVDLMLCGHVHMHIKQEANSRVHFPVLINSNNAIVKGHADGNKLVIDVIDPSGKKTDQLVINTH